jgi:hypothetical protein
LAGVAVNPTPLQTVADIEVIAGLGLTVIVFVSEVVPQVPPLVVSVRFTEAEEVNDAI